jgi:hypothetical protein
MEEYRSMINRDEEGFLKIIGPVAEAGIFTVEGDLYKRGRYAGAIPEIAQWYDRKNIYVAANRCDVAETYDFNALTARLAAGFSALTGIYRLWLEAAFR